MSIKQQQSYKKIINFFLIFKGYLKGHHDSFFYIYEYDIKWRYKQVVGMVVADTLTHNSFHTEI